MVAVSGITAAASIGRVGALAVALGVGWAILSASGVATAETGDAGGTSSEAATKADRSDDRTASASSAQSTPRRAGKSTEDAEADSGRDDSDDDSAPVRHTSKRDRAGEDAVETETVSIAPESEDEQSGADVGDGPGDPAASPIGLLLVAGSRREVKPTNDGEFAAGVNSAPTASLRWQGTARWYSPSVRGAVSATDPDGDKLTYTGAVTERGTLTVTSRGSFTFKPTAAARHAAAATTATDSEKFQNLVISVSDGKGGVVSVPIRVEILPANRAPSWVRSNVGKPDSTNGLVTGRISASDGDGDGLRFSASNPAAGSVILNTDGTFTYRPTPVARSEAQKTWYTDKDQFTVTVDDGHGGLKTVTVRVTISPGDNKSPAFSDPRVTITSTNSSNGVVTGRINAADPEGSPLRFELAEAVPAGTGSVALDVSTGAFTFTPTEAARLAAHNTPGEDLAWFKVTVSDEQTSATADIGVPVIAKAPAPPPPPPSNWTRPLGSYRVTQEYGGSHTGIDLAASSGSPVYAAADGVIYHEGWGTSDRAGKPSDWMGTQAGISILVRHDGLGVMTGYAHLSRTIIDVGQRVSKGQLIGYVGCTGSCSGPHLHFEVLPMPLSSSRGILGRVNPRNYLSL